MKIALIAHNGKKAEMVAFLLSHKKFLANSELVATGTTGTHIENANLKVTKLLSGPLGGDAQIAAMAAMRKIGMVIFFRDPLASPSTDLELRSLV